MGLLLGLGDAHFAGDALKVADAPLEAGGEDLLFEPPNGDTHVAVGVEDVLIEGGEDDVSLVVLVDGRDFCGRLAVDAARAEGLEEGLVHRLPLRSVSCLTRRRRAREACWASAMFARSCRHPLALPEGRAWPCSGVGRRSPARCRR